MVYATVTPLIRIIPEQAHCLIYSPFQGTNGKVRLYLTCHFPHLGQTRHCCDSYSKRRCSHSDNEANNYRCWHCRENAQPASRPFFQPAFPVQRPKSRCFACRETAGFGGACSPFIPPAAELHTQSRLGQTRQRCES